MRNNGLEHSAVDALWKLSHDWYEKESAVTEGSPEGDAFSIVWEIQIWEGGLAGEGEVFSSSLDFIFSMYLIISTTLFYYGQEERREKNKY